MDILPQCTKACRNKKTKSTQNKVQIENIAVTTKGKSHTRNEQSGTYLPHTYEEMIELDKSINVNPPKYHSRKVGQKHKPKRWKSVVEWYGGEETTVVLEPDKTNEAVSKDRKQVKKQTDIDARKLQNSGDSLMLCDCRKKIESNKKGNTYKIDEEESQDFDIYKRDDNETRKSLKRKDSLVLCDCKRSLKSNKKAKDNKFEVKKNRDALNPGPYGDVTYNNNTNKSVLNKAIIKNGECQKGLCVEAATKTNIEFTCKCKKRKFTATECRNTTCATQLSNNTGNGVNNSVTMTESLLKTKLQNKKLPRTNKEINFKTKYESARRNKTQNNGQRKENLIRSLCRKYSQKLKQCKRGALEYNTCKSGVCKKAYELEKKEFSCKCKPEVIECTDVTCGSDGKNVYFGKKILSPMSKKLPNKTDLLKSEPSNKSIAKKNFMLMKTRVQERRRNKKKRGVPITKYKTVRNANDQTGEPIMEIKVKAQDMCLLNYDEIHQKVRKLGRIKPPCICPEDIRKMEFSTRRVCETGVCRKAFQENKMSYFNCKCPRKPFQCTDATCDTNKSINKIPVKEIKPSLEGSEPIHPLFNVNVDKNTGCIVNNKEIQDRVIGFSYQICDEGLCRDAALNNDTDFTCNCVMKKPQPEVIECKTCKCRHEGSDSKSSQNVLKKPCCLSRIFCKSQHSSSGSRKQLRSKNIHKRNGLNINTGQHCICKVCGDISKNDEKKDKQMNKKAIKDSCTCCICQAGKTETKIHTTRRSTKNVYKRKPSLFKTQLKSEKIQYETEIQKKEKTAPSRINKLDMEISPYEQETEMERRENNNHVCGCEKEVRRQERKKYAAIKKDAKEREKGKITYVCGCDYEMQKQKAKIATAQMKMLHKTESQKMIELEKSQKRKMKLKVKAKAYRDKEESKLNRLKKKQFKRRMAIEEKRRRKKAKQDDKWRNREIKKLTKDMGKRETNCLVETILGTLKIAAAITKTALILIFKLVTNPKGSYHYLKTRANNPQNTWYTLKRWMAQHCKLIKLRMQTTIQGSEKLSILSDEIQSTPVYQAIIPKGKTDIEARRQANEQKARLRRIQRRKAAALRSCGHAYLHTLRKHPCLWFYHIFPRLYPQCVSCLHRTRSFCDVFLFLCAVMFWTPCIISFELCRALCCCLMCTR